MIYPETSHVTKQVIYYTFILQYLHIQYGQLLKKTRCRKMTGWVTDQNVIATGEVGLTQIVIQQINFF